MSSPSRRPVNPQRSNSGIEPFPSYPVELPAEDIAPTAATTTAAAGTPVRTIIITGPDAPVPTTTYYAPDSLPSQAAAPAAAAAAGGLALAPHAQQTVPTITTPTSNSSYTVRRRPISIRRLPTASSIRDRALVDGSQATLLIPDSGPTRARSTSAPQSPLHSTVADSGHERPGHERASRHPRQSAQHQPDLPSLAEDSTLAQQYYNHEPVQPTDTTHLTVPGYDGGSRATTPPGTVENGGNLLRMRSWSGAARSFASRLSGGSDDINTPSHRRPDYENEVVDLLDVIDPEVSALTTLTNVQNSLFVPDLGRWVNRRPTYTLSKHPSQQALTQLVEDGNTRAATPAPLQRSQEQEQTPPQRPPSVQREYSWQGLAQPRQERSHSISSDLTDSHYAVLPHGLSLDGWSEEDKEALDDYVRHMLHSKRSKFKQAMKAFGKYMSTPLGFVVTLYATLITLFGLAWVLFLIGWIYAGTRQSYVVNVIDNVLVALFALIGDGMAPFRTVDTYHMIYIAHYHRLSWKLRQERNLPALKNQNDLPQRFEKDVDPEGAAVAEEEKAEFIVLTRTQQKKLIHHQSKFSKSHTWYKAHETVTHHAFPIKLLITVVVLLDCHSILQIMLGTFTWAWSYHTRPEWITSVILSFSITVNITAGIVIGIGDRITRKKDVVERMSRQKVTQQAIKKVQKEKQRGGGHHEHPIEHTGRHEEVHVGQSAGQKPAVRAA